MKKKILLSVFTLVVVTLTAFVGYKAYVPKATVADLLLDENIEALTQNEDEEEAGCKTLEKPFSSISYINGYKIGREGTMYTCEKGTLADCKEGYSGYDYSMTPYPGTKTTFDETQTRECK